LTAVGPRLLTDRDELETLFDELGAELTRLGTTAEVVMVGGSWMLWHSQRASTRDVDSARRFDTDISEAVERAGFNHDLSAGWLNDAAAAFWPSGASYDDCEVVYQQGPVLVRTPSPDIIFVMKLYRAHPQDREDLVTLWPRAIIGSSDLGVDVAAAAAIAPPLLRAGIPDNPPTTNIGSHAIGAVVLVSVMDAPQSGPQ